jgi:hypothetical protein
LKTAATLGFLGLSSTAGFDETGLLNLMAIPRPPFGLNSGFGCSEILGPASEGHEGSKGGSLDGGGTKRGGAILVWWGREGGGILGGGTRGGNERGGAPGGGLDGGRGREPLVNGGGGGQTFWCLFRGCSSQKLSPASLKCLLLLIVRFLKGSHEKLRLLF